MAELSHKALVDAARRWLISRHRCRWVICEKPAYSSAEIPDALGFTPIHTYLVECKVSRSDFQADQKKIFRQAPHMGVGEYRYYLTPEGLLAREDLPDGWGLLEMRGTHRRWLPREKVTARPFAERARHIEQAILVSEMVVIRMLLQGRDVVPSARLKALAAELGLEFRVSYMGGYSGMRVTGFLRGKPVGPQKSKSKNEDQTSQAELFPDLEPEPDPLADAPEDPEDLDLTEGGQERNVRRAKLVRDAQKGNHRSREILRDEFGIVFQEGEQL